MEVEGWKSRRRERTNNIEDRPVWGRRQLTLDIL
jgi:hypothetical protein